MSAKTELIQRLEYLNDAVNDSLVTDVGLMPSQHNGVAALLRKGLGIVAFNMLEDFIKNRSSEALSFLSGSGIAFNKLTQELQNSSTEGALRALNFQASLRKKETGFDLLGFLQTEAYSIYSTSIHPYSLSRFSFAYSNPNVSSAEITDLLKAFGIENSWPQLKFISDSIGGGIPDLAAAFKNASIRRHGAAHNATFDYTHSWLLNIKAEILAIAGTIDIALTAKCRQVIRNPHLPLNSSDISDELNFRFLEVASASSVKEKKRLGGKTIKNWSSQSAAVSALTTRLFARKEFLIIQNSSKRVIDWMS